MTGGCELIFAAIVIYSGANLAKLAEPSFDVCPIRLRKAPLRVVSLSLALNPNCDIAVDYRKKLKARR